MARAVLIFKDRIAAAPDLTKIGLSLSFASFLTHSVFFSCYPTSFFCPKRKTKQNKVQRWSLLEKPIGQMKGVVFHDWLALLFIPLPISCLIELKNFSIPGSNFWYKNCHFGELTQDFINLEGGYWEMEGSPELRIFLLCFPCTKTSFLSLVKWSEWNMPLGKATFRPSVSLACHECHEGLFQ